MIEIFLAGIICLLFISMAVISIFSILHTLVEAVQDMLGIYLIPSVFGSRG